VLSADTGALLYSDYVVMDVYSTEVGIRLSFVKTLGFRGGV
jgi:hypothetical protein